MILTDNVIYVYPQTHLIQQEFTVENNENKGNEPEMKNQAQPDNADTSASVNNGSTAQEQAAAGAAVPNPNEANAQNGAAAGASGKKSPEWMHNYSLFILFSPLILMALIIVESILIGILRLTGAVHFNYIYQSTGQAVTATIAFLVVPILFNIFTAVLILRDKKINGKLKPAILSNPIFAFAMAFLPLFQIYTTVYSVIRKPDVRVLFHGKAVDGLARNKMFPLLGPVAVLLIAFVAMCIHSEVFAVTHPTESDVQKLFREPAAWSKEFLHIKADYQGKADFDEYLKIAKGSKSIIMEYLRQSLNNPANIKDSPFSQYKKKKSSFPCEAYGKEVCDAFDSIDDDVAKIKGLSEPAEEFYIEAIENADSIFMYDITVRDMAGALGLSEGRNEKETVCVLTSTTIPVMFPCDKE